MVATIHDLINKHGPMRVTDLEFELRRLKRPATYGSIYATLIKDNRFEKVAPGVFGLRKITSQAS